MLSVCFSKTVILVSTTAIAFIASMDFIGVGMSLSAGVVIPAVVAGLSPSSGARTGVPPNSGVV